MPATLSSSFNFVGTSGALTMSFISMSIVFLVIIGLMFIMKATNMAVSACMLARSSKDGPKEGC